MGWFSKPVAAVVQAVKRGGFLTRVEDSGPPPKRTPVADAIAQQLADMAKLAPHAAPGFAMDSIDGTGIKDGYAFSGGSYSEPQLQWFLSQGFIGFQVCAFLLQHWLIAKACYTPARDAIRQGYRIVSEDGGDLDDEIVKRMKQADKRFKLNAHMVDFVGTGRGFGVRIALFKVASSDPKYYELPFNPDGVTPGSYRGIVQIDPQWCSPDLDQTAAADPASIHFYEPTWWLIGGNRYHRSHLIIFRNGCLPDILKPAYRYGGVPLPQRIMERIYCAERTANEAPQLAMTKRTTAMGVDSEAALANPSGLREALSEFVNYRDNYSVKLYDKDTESVMQLDTSLADLDAVIMSQYQIVAAIANVPATKLIGTTPKGFQSTGEFEEASYHEELESIQTSDLTPLLERHHMLVMRSEIAPTLPGGKPLATSVVWEALDSPTAKEVAETDKIRAETDAVLVTAGAIDGIDVRDRIRKDKNGGHYGILEAERGELEEPPADPLDPALPVT